MRKKNDLSKQILSFMLGLTLCIIFISVIGSYAFYTLIDTFFSVIPASEEDVMTGADWLWIIIASLISLLFAVFFALKLSSRILSPISSVANSLQQLAHGDLSARAETKKSYLIEINNLVSDFNAMAEKLQVMDVDRKSWNAAIAHELRTPVTILRGRLQGLVEGVFTPEPSLFKNLLAQTEGLSRLIDDLRMVGASGSTAFSLHIVSTHFESLISKSVDSFYDKFEKLGFTLNKRLTDDEIFCDTIRLTQCLNIITDNIINYSTPGDVDIVCNKDSTFYSISLTDSGPGIDADFQPYMFEPFQRGKLGRSTNPNGCGLGLSIVRAIMKAHGGDVSYQQSAAGASTFTLQWPVRERA